jgi:predicted MPP superfamily phosphohydrolase
MRSHGTSRINGPCRSFLRTTCLEEASLYRMTRRALLSSLAAAAAAGACYPCVLEPRWLEMTETMVSVSRVKRIEPARVLHLSDLHASVPVAMSTIREAVSQGIALKPDIACVTGDFITTGGDVQASGYVQILRGLAQTVPTFAVLGNHDGGIWARRRLGQHDTRLVRRLLEESGIELLHNRSRQIEIRGESIEVVGVGDLWAEELDAPRAFANVDRSCATVLLSHNPDSKEVLAHQSWDLMLSGHTHGGQVRIPLHGDRFAPVIDKRYVAGLKAWEDRQIFVTRGVGNLHGVRFRCRPEVSLLVMA